ncbi:MAG: Cys-tRNA(Pro) deacylase [Pseudonocardia sp.]|nr:Cys-tRNA(Pro) deacylase [Pseudonocardia sp.]
MAGQGTPATALLTKRKITHRVHTYVHRGGTEWSAGGTRVNTAYGAEAADALGQDPRRVFKTLVALVDGTMTVGIVPVTATLDLKALATAAGGKRARMAEVTDAERTTGYVAGGISPLGQRKRLPTVVDASVHDFATLYCSGGRRGLEIELSPDDLIALTSATVAPIATTP